LYYIRPKDDSRYSIAYTPNESGYHTLPVKYYPSEFVLQFNLEAKRVVITNSEHGVVVGWITLTSDLEEQYKEAVSSYKKMIRPVLEGNFRTSSEKFAVSANVV